MFWLHPSCRADRAVSFRWEITFHLSEHTLTMHCYLNAGGINRTVVGTNLCVPVSLEVKDKGIREFGRGSARGNKSCPDNKRYFPAAVLFMSLSHFVRR